MNAAFLQDLAGKHLVLGLTGGGGPGHAAPRAPRGAPPASATTSLSCAAPLAAVAW